MTTETSRAADDGPGAEEGAERPSLKRAIGPRLLLLFVVGDMLGGGIYALVGEVGAEVGGAIWASFLAAFVLATLTAFAYAELVTKYPYAAGAALYTNRAFGLPFLTFMVAFAVMASGITSASALSRAFAGDYFNEFIDLPLVPVALGFVILVALINLRGIAESVRVNAVFTVIEVLGLLLILVVVVASLGNEGADLGRTVEFKEGESLFFAIAGGATLAFYALIGFEDSVNVAEETREPRAYPRVLFASLAIVGVIYLLVTFGASAIVPTDQLAGSSGPLLEVVREGSLGIPLKLFSAIALFALANGALINMIMASRLVYGMSRERIVPGVFGRVLPGRRTPAAAIVFTTALALVLVATGDLGDLADTTVMLLLAVFAVVNVAVLVLRRDPVDHDHFQTPSFLPVIGALVSIFLITQNDAEVFLRAAAVLAAGVALWVVNRAAAERTSAA